MTEERHKLYCWKCKKRIWKPSKAKRDFEFYPYHEKCYTLEVIDISPNDAGRYVIIDHEVNEQ